MAEENAIDQTPLVVKRSLWRRIVATGIVLSGLCWITFLFALTLTDQDISGRDYIQYWAEGRQVLLHANPYDDTAILRLEQSAGPGRMDAEQSGSPPLVLLLAAAMGVFSAKTGLILWFAVLFSSLSAALWILWKVHGSPNTLLFLFGFLFAPVLACLQCGQISILFLLSIVAFLNFHETRPWLAGALLVPLALKPHLFLPFAIALLLWVLNRRVYGILAGFVLALGACLAFVYWLDPHAWQQYAQMMRTENLIADYVPTLSDAMQHLINPRWVWLRFVPDAGACLWAAWYFRSRRERWRWTHQGMVVLLVSCLCAPYGFFFDEAVLLPAVLTAVLQARQSGRFLWPIAIAAAAALIESAQLVKITSLYYLWTIPAWLLWYLYATRNGRTMNAHELTLAKGQP
jgi:hypothetical protein